MAGVVQPMSLHPATSWGVHIDRRFILEAYLLVSAHILRKVFGVQNLWNNAYKVGIRFEGFGKPGEGPLNGDGVGSKVENVFYHEMPL